VLAEGRAGPVDRAGGLGEPRHHVLHGEGPDLEVDDPEIGPFPMQNVVPRLTETPGEVRWTGPALGQHNDEVYGGLLGIGEAEREKLREGGIV